MKKLTRLFCFSAIAFTLLTAFSSRKCKTADLAITNINPPEYVHDIRGTVITLNVKNKGKARSTPCQLKIYDLDLSVDEARAMKLDTLYIDMIAENNARASYFSEEKHHIDSNQFDYDLDWVGFVDIPELNPGQTFDVTFSIENYWVYDSNCEIRAIVDYKQLVEDCNRSNNQKDFFGWG